MMTDERPAQRQSDRRLLVQAHFNSLGVGQLSVWLHGQREAGRSWAHISRDLYDLTGIDVSYETLRQWVARDQQAQEQ